VTQRERESLPSGPPGALGEDDPHSFLFGDDDEEMGAPRKVTRSERRRSDQGRRRTRKRRGRLFVLLTLLIVVAVGALVVPRVIDYFGVADYSGSGSGTVAVTVHTGDSTQDIGDTLQKAGVVKSSRAFTDACGDTKCASIQPGVYNLKRHMSGVAARNLILDPAARSAAGDLVVPEGATSLDVQARLAKILGADKQGAIAAAMKAGQNLGLPLKYTGKGDGVPTSPEGFLYPATYTVDPSSSPAKVLQTMVSRYLKQDRQTGFADAAAKIGLTPYQALIIASIAQSEAKFPEDMPMVARTILNRIKSTDGVLQFDSTSSYACKLTGIAADKCIYDSIDSPYNTYTHKGLPPTPIDNPGAEAMKAAVTPPAGNWLFFVNKDAAGHLFFTNDDKAFEAARVKCVKNHWGCGN
jgi:UPF0755 protein